MMKSPIKNLIKSILKKFDLGIMKHSTLQILQENQRTSDDIAVLLNLPNRHSSQLLQNFESSKSQLRQDLFVLSELEFKKDGFFVEFGATNGVDLSNTYLLEKRYGWKGILAEPAKCWHSAIKLNRTAHIETNCVWSTTDSVLTFNEAVAPELSTINSYSGNDSHKKARNNGSIYNVKTISLNDLLTKYDAPLNIDYLSIDTEGSEFEILRNLDFDKYKFSVITCEHNYTPMREKIFELLSRHGYIRKFEIISKFDDWYVKAK